MENLENENLQEIKLKAGEYVDNNTIYNLRNTKALSIESVSKTEGVKVNVSTWSSLIKNAIDILRPQLNYVKGLIDSTEFIDTFEVCLKEICDKQEFRLNANCPKRLYREAEETDLIHSSVYMNSKNHFIPIIEDEEGIPWGLCAVYTGEIIIMLETLLDTIASLVKEYRPDYADKYPYHTLVLTYINRDDIIKEKDNVENTTNSEPITVELSKDLLKLQKKLIDIQNMSTDIYSDIENIQTKYNLQTLNDLLT